MSAVSAVAGKQLYIKCPVAGYPIESIVWEKGKRRVIFVNPLDREYREFRVRLRIQYFFIVGKIYIKISRRFQQSLTSLFHLFIFENLFMRLKVN